MAHTIKGASGLVEVKFEIYESDGFLCASGIGVGIYTYARTWNKLMKNIKDAVELYYDMPPKTEFKLLLETRMNQNAESALKTFEREMNKNEEAILVKKDVDQMMAGIKSGEIKTKPYGETRKKLGLK